MAYYNIQPIRGPSAVQSFYNAERQRAGTQAIELANQQRQYDIDTALPEEEMLAARRAEVQHAADANARANMQAQAAMANARAAGVKAAQAETEAWFEDGLKGDLAVVREYERVLEETGNADEAQMAAEMMDVEMDNSLRARYPHLQDMPSAGFEYGPTRSFLEGYGMLDPLNEAKIRADIANKESQIRDRESDSGNAGTGSEGTQSERLMSEVDGFLEKGVGNLTERELDRAALVMRELFGEGKSRDITDSQGNKMRSIDVNIPERLWPLAAAAGVRYGTSTSMTARTTLTPKKMREQAVETNFEMASSLFHAYEVAKIIDQNPQVLALPGIATATVGKVTEMMGGDSALARQVISARAALEQQGTSLLTAVKPLVDKGVFSKDDWTLTERLAGVTGWLDTPTAATAKLKSMLKDIELQVQKNEEVFKSTGYNIMYQDGTGIAYAYPKDVTDPAEKLRLAEPIPGSAMINQFRDSIDKLESFKGIDLGPGAAPDGSE